MSATETDPNSPLISGSDLSWQALADTTVDAWGLFAGIEMTVDQDASSGTAGAVFTTCCMISGPWNGGVVIVAPLTLVQQATSTMLECDIGDLSDDDMRDALGELCNVIAGNVLALLNASSALALPVVTEGSDYEVHIPKGRVLGHVKLVSEDQVCQVMMVEGLGG